MEINAQTIKNITAMNIHAGVHEILKALGQEVKHIGNHISERAGHLLDQQANTSLNEAEVAEMNRMEHLLSSCSNVMEMVTAAVQANDIGYGMVNTEPSDSADEVDTVREVVTASAEYKKLIEILNRLKRETSRNSVDELMALLGGDLWEQDSVNGN